MKKTLITLAMMTSITAYACQFSTDCEVGSECIKDPGQLYGYCAGGISPGNSNDKTPVYDPLDANHTTGDTCSFNLDCGVGGKCLKESGSLDGVCVN